MTQTRLSDELALQAIEAVKKYGDVSAAATALGINLKTFTSRVRVARERFPDALPPANRKSGWANPDRAAYALEIEAWHPDGHVVIFGDAHYGWSEKPPPCHMALISVIRAIRPVAVIANGDIIDGAGSSRHPDLGHQRKPSMADEVIRAQLRLGEIAEAAGDAALYRTVGNHDQRYDKHLATHAPEFAALHGMRLRDHLEAWEEAWRVRVNQSLVVLHGYHNGVHAAWNNAMRAGMHIATNHTHALEVRPFSDYRGRRFAVQCGMIADARDAAFEFVGGKPVQWGEGFAVLTFADGELLTPRLCERIGNRFWFNGEVVHAVEEGGRRSKEAAPAKAGAGRVLRAGMPSSGSRDGGRGTDDARRLGKPQQPKTPHRRDTGDARRRTRAA